VAREAAAGPRPTNLKLFSASHFHHVERVWRDEDARDWRAHPGGYSSGHGMPWARIAHPTELGATLREAHARGAHAGRSGDARRHAAAYLFVDFHGLDGARALAAGLDRCPGRPAVLGE